MVRYLNENKLNNNHHSIICEVNRKEIIGKSKTQSVKSKERYRKSSEYKPKIIERGIRVDLERLLDSGQLVIQVPQGKELQYTNIVAYYGFLDRLWYTIKKQNSPNVTLATVREAVRKSIDDGDIEVDCSCPDFIYRFNYISSKLGYHYGQPETRPSKITNPNDTLGAVCKHLLGTLREKDRFAMQASTVINNAIKKYPDLFREALGLDEDEFVV